MGAWGSSWSCLLTNLSVSRLAILVDLTATLITRIPLIHSTRVGHIIQRFNGDPICSSGELLASLKDVFPGDHIAAQVSPESPEPAGWPSSLSSPESLIIRINLKAQNNLLRLLTRLTALGGGRRRLDQDDAAHSV